MHEKSLKNLMKKMNEYIKDRTEAFENLQKAKIDYVKNWFKVFRFFYNYVLTRKLVQPQSQMDSFQGWLIQFCWLQAWGDQNELKLTAPSHIVDALNEANRIILSGHAKDGMKMAIDFTE